MAVSAAAAAAAAAATQPNTGIEAEIQKRFFFRHSGEKGRENLGKKMGVEKLLISTDFEKRFHVGERERRGKQRSVIFRSDLLFCETG